MPYFAGQKMFADELHGWVLILAQGLLIATRIVFVLGWTFQQDAVFPRDSNTSPSIFPFSVIRSAFSRS
jgi:hypothetical protein